MPRNSEVAIFNTYEFAIYTTHNYSIRNPIRTKEFKEYKNNESILNNSRKKAYTAPINHNCFLILSLLQKRESKNICLVS
jgi:hypothetical protein